MTSVHTDTLWATSSGLRTTEPHQAAPHYPALQGRATTDVCVIGAGLAGLTTAYLLLREGRAVTVIDAADVGAGVSGRSTAHFAPPDERYFEIERGFGADRAALVADSYRQAMDCVEAIVRREQMACEFERVDGYLFNPGGAWDDVLEREYAVTTRLGLDVVRRERVPGLPFDTGPCLRFARQAQLHPLRYLDALARAIVRLGGKIHERTRAVSMQGDRTEQVVGSGQASIAAKAVVIATNRPFNERAALHEKQTVWHSYVVALRVPRDALPHVLLWDTGDPYHYVRLASGGSGVPYDLLLVGGQDHPAAADATAGERYAALETWARARYAFAGAVQYRWSGEVMEPADGLAYLGRNVRDQDNVYVITGDSGNGMTHGTVGAMLVSDLIAGRPNSWTELYDPARKAFHGLGGFITEQAGTLAQYTEWLRGGDVDSSDQIARGEGALLRDGGRLLAVYRSDDGGLQAVSAACTHLGCAVRWNTCEKSWDCRCHGSRFDAGGGVLHGPARRPLTPATLVDTGHDGAPDGALREQRT